MRRLTTAMALALLAWSGAPAQTIDQGVFQLFRDGQPVGSETFVIQRTGSGDNATIVARGRIVRTDGPRELRTSLQLQGSPPRPTAYELVVEGDEALRVLARSNGRRFSVRTISPSGERMREFLVADGGMILDDLVVHHHYFIARPGAERTTELRGIVPRRSSQFTARVEPGGTETITLGDTSVQATHLAVLPADGDPRHLWVDDQGRVLRLTIPARGFTAVRDRPPG